MEPSQDSDRAVIASLAENGADLTKPAHIVHYLYFKSIAAAEAAATELKAAGYRIKRVGKAPVTSLWQRLFGPASFSCIAETNIAPSEENVSAASDFMNGLASKHGGEYDGWESSVER